MTCGTAMVRSGRLGDGNASKTSAPSASGEAKALGVDGTGFQPAVQPWRWPPSTFKCLLVARLKCGVQMVRPKQVGELNVILRSYAKGRVSEAANAMACHLF